MRSNSVPYLGAITDSKMSASTAVVALRRCRESHIRVRFRSEADGFHLTLQSGHSNSRLCDQFTQASCVSGMQLFRPRSARYGTTSAILKTRVHFFIGEAVEVSGLDRDLLYDAGSGPLDLDKVLMRFGLVLTPNWYDDGYHSRHGTQGPRVSWV